MVAIGHQHPEVALIHCDGHKVDQHGQDKFGYMSLFEHHPPQGVHRAILELFKNNYITAQGALIRREWLNQHYPYSYLFNPEFTYACDYLAWIELLLRGGEAYYHPQKLIAFRAHEGSHTMPHNLIPRLAEEPRIFRQIAAICPAELEPQRRQALCDRLARLAFLLIEAGRAEEAKPYLHEALKIEGRNDLRVAHLISGLPVPATLKRKLWQVVERVAATVKGKA
jgi:hypothetical protein